MYYTNRSIGDTNSIIGGGIKSVGTRKARWFSPNGLSNQSKVLIDYDLALGAVQIYAGESNVSTADCSVDWCKITIQGCVDRHIATGCLHYNCRIRIWGINKI